jgi:signal peptidase I
LYPPEAIPLRHGSVSKEQLRRVVRRDGHRVSFSENGLRVDGQRRTYYVVEQAYYFVLGDNLDMSQDSRHWGLVPETNLVGPVLGIVWPLRIGDSLS